MQPSLERILIVDDEEDILDCVAVLCRHSGRVFDRARDGVEALWYLEKYQYAAVICDIRMPEMDGVELLSRVRQKSDTTPFLMLTGFASQSDEVRLSGLGAYAIHSKTEIIHLRQPLEKLLQDGRLFQQGRQIKDKDEEDFLRLLNGLS